MGGFDLTDIKINQVPKRQEPQQAQRPIQQQAPAQPPVASVDDALHKNVADDLYDEEGKPWKDKRPPGLKRSLWAVDKFIEPDGMLKDKDGNPIIRSSDMPKAKAEDRQDLIQE